MEYITDLKDKRLGFSDASNGYEGILHESLKVAISRAEKAEGALCRAKRRARYNGTSDIQVSYRANDDPRGLLIEGKVYDVEYINKEEWHTDVYLVGYAGKRFNSVCFDLFTDTGPCPHAAEVELWKKQAAFESEHRERYRARLALADAVVAALKTSDPDTLRWWATVIDALAAYDKEG